HRPSYTHYTYTTLFRSQTYSALMEDLDGRGLLDETLVVLMGEMGRTPKINKDGGRDHWTYCYSVLLAGAGVRGGSVCGASDAGRSEEHTSELQSRGHLV